MRIFAGAFALLTVLGLVPATEAGGLHTATGVVLSVDLRAGRIVMTHDDAHPHVLVVNLTTSVIDEAGTPQPGDLEREECVPNGSGPRGGDPDLGAAAGVEGPRQPRDVARGRPGVRAPGAPGRLHTTSTRPPSKLTATPVM